MNRLVAGLAGGLAGTAAMTVAMELMHRRLPRRQRYPLPPRQVAINVARKAGVARHMDERQRFAWTLVSHFGYGTTTGLVFAATAARLPLPAPVKGVGFALGVWGGSYLGWLPAAGLISPATEHPAARNAVMIAAHAVWGLAAGFVVDALDQPDGTSTAERAEREVAGV